MSQMGRERGQYRIHAVAEMTGVPSATLRAWERRYGIPSPARTTAAYRLYSDEDVELVRRLRDLCARGLAPAEAARLLKASVEGIGDASPLDPVPTDRDAFEVAIRRIEDAVATYDVQAIETEVRNALFLGSATTVFERVISPVQVRIGEAWHNGVLSIAQEHLASEILLATTRDLLRLMQRDDAPRDCLLACFVHEDHLLPLHGIAFRFAGWGFRTVLMGARTPPEALADAVRSVQPDVVALSCTIAPAPEDAPDLIRGYAEACRTTPWVVGGRGLPALAKLIEGNGGIAGWLHDPPALRTKIEDALVLRRLPQA